MTFAFEAVAIFVVVAILQFHELARSTTLGTYVFIVIVGSYSSEFPDF